MLLLQPLTKLQHGKADHTRRAVKSFLACRDATQMAERTASGSLTGPSHSQGMLHTGAWQVLALPDAHTADALAGVKGLVTHDEALTFLQ